MDTLIPQEPKPKKQKIKNPNYRAFLDSGIINILSEEHILRALANIKGRYVRESRALLIALYYTGGRPNEVLRLTGKDIAKVRHYVTVSLKGSKHGMPRTVYLPYKSELVKELYLYGISCFADAFIFFHFQNKYKRFKPNKKGILKEYIDISDKLRYHFSKWFSGVIPDSIPPYYLRHNRFSKLIQSGASMEDIMLLKGSKKLDSVRPYMHMSSERAEKLSKKMK